MQSCVQYLKVPLNWIRESLRSGIFMTRYDYLWHAASDPKTLFLQSTSLWNVIIPLDFTRILFVQSHLTCINSWKSCFFLYLVRMFPPGVSLGWSCAQIEVRFPLCLLPCVGKPQASASHRKSGELLQIYADVTGRERKFMTFCPKQMEYC